MSNADWLDDGTLMWPHITSPLARRVLAAVFYKISEPMTGSPEKPAVNFGEKHELKLRRKLRARLHNSGLAQAIAAGQDSIPSRFDYLPRWQQLISRHNAPKTHEQLAVHVMFNLDWYLDNPKPANLISPGSKVTFYTLLLTSLGIFFYTQGATGIGATLVIGSTFITGSTILLALRAITDSTKGDVDLIKQSEFYLYLLDCYGELDTEDDGNLDEFEKKYRL